jgi:hypothetical protein
VTQTYSGSCHCGAIRFAFQSEPITEGLQCNCSFCSRRQAVMLPFTLSPEELKREIDGDALGCYQFGNKVAKHHFCKICGIYPFHETMRKPGHFRVNLGCVDGLDAYSLPRTVFNGRELLK